MRRDKAELSCDAKDCKEVHVLQFRAEPDAWPKGWLAYEIRPIGETRMSVVHLCSKHRELFVDLVNRASVVEIP